jgi:cation:H+ antiporter
MSQNTGDSYDPIEPIRSVDRLLVREWLLLAVVMVIALPAPVLRGLEIAHVWEPHLGPEFEAIIFGIGIFAAATLLTWASEVAETEVSAGLALVALALIAVLPEYAVDLYFAIEAPHAVECIETEPVLIPPGCDDPHPGHLAVANMTGGNRLLVGLAWPVIFFIFWRKFRQNTMPIERGNAIGILFLGLATLYSFSIPIRGYLSLVDTAIMFSLFGAYLFIAAKSPPSHETEFVGPAAAIGALSKFWRRAVVLGLFVYAAGVIFAAAEPFAESLVETGESLGIDEFILVQWVAPLASESPEFILAALLAVRGRYASGMTILISSKVNQWTLLIGSLPLAYSISGGTLEPLDFDTRQSEEIFLTAGQSLFAVAILFTLSMSRWEATLLFLLFITQFVFTQGSIRVAYGVVYCALALAIFIRDAGSGPTFFSAVKESWTDPGGKKRAGSEQAARSPPDPAEA